MLLQNLHPNCWSDQRPVQRRCSSVVRRTANVAPELVQLERSCLADLSTEELELQLKLHGIPVQTRLPEVKQLQSSTVPTGTHGCNAQQAGGLHMQRQHQQNRQPQPQLQPQQESTQLVQQQQNKQEQEAQQHAPRQHHQQLQPGPRVQQQQIKARARRVAASAARRALLLEQLANARVQARSRIVRLPLRLSIAGRAKSRRYLTLPVDVEGAGFIDFLMDSSAYLSRITPGMRDKLGIGPVDGVAILTGGSSTSTSSRGSTNNNSSSSSSRARVRLRQKVRLPKMWLGTAQLPPQQAFVTPLQLPPRQQQFRAAGSTVQRMAAVGAVGGVLGVQVLREFEIDIDFGGNSIALHPPGHVDLGLCDTRGMVEIPLRLTKTGALVIPVSLAGSSPFTGLLDLSATSSMLNWEAAALLGMTCKLDEDDDEQCGSSGGDGGGGGGGSRASKLAAQQQRQQQPAIKHVGKFGSLEVVPSDEMLLKPRLPAASPPQHSSRDSSSPGRPGKQHPPLVPPRSAQQPGGSSSSGATYSYRPLSSSSIVQQAQVAACEVRLVLGHARLAAATSGSNSNAAAVEGNSISISSSSITASLALPPPNRFGVAGLKAVGQLGLSGQPVMVVGWDVWARQRVVLCLKAGKVFLSAAPS